MGYLINPRWIDIPEEGIYKQLRPLGIKSWGIKSFPVAGSYRHYLFGGQYAYPYHLPTEVIKRLAARLNDESNFVTLDFQSWIRKFKEHYQETGTIYNDVPVPPSGLPGVTIKTPANIKWRVLGIHKLTPQENRGNHNVFIEVLCKQGDRAGFEAIHWDWAGRLGNEPPPGVVFAGQKGPDELIDLPIHVPMRINVWLQDGEEAGLFHSEWPDEDEGNTYGHHSFFVCFEEVDQSAPPPEPPGPDPEPPDPEPPTTIQGKVLITVNWAWVSSLTPDADGNVTIEGELN